MIVTITANLSQEWGRHLRDSIGDRATVLEAASREAAVELLQSVPADLVVCEITRVTDEQIETLQRVRAQAGEALLVTIAPDEVVERMRLEALAAPDLWIRSDAAVDDRNQLLSQAVETARLRGEMEQIDLSTAQTDSVLRADERRPQSFDAFNRLISGLTGGFDLDRLLDACVDAVSQFIQCASYCLLWEEAADGNLHVHRHRGIRGEVVADGRLSPVDALPTWYRRNRRVLTFAELSGWADRKGAVRVQRELDLFGGQIALPLMVRGRLAGILILGEKVLGERYTGSEIETLFSVANHVALAAEGIELHQELARSKAYTDSIVESMGAGLITLGNDERIAVCNPYAAHVLGLERGSIEGSDLRALPSPLGDMLYGALRSEGDDVICEEVHIRGGGTTLRVNTSRVHGLSGEILGSVLLLDDITAERELALERNRREQLDVLTSIVGRIAHEVKNPLTAVKTYAELMSGRRPDERLAQFWSQTVLPEIDKLDEMLKNLLRMVEEPEPHVESMSVNDLLERALETLPMAEEIKRQSFDLQFAKDLPPVMVDPGPTCDAFSYLLAYLAGSKPSPVEVEVVRNEDDSGELLILMSRRSRVNGSFDPSTVFDPLHAMQDPDSDLWPVIGQKIISSQHGRVDAWHEEGRMAMRVALPVAPARVPLDQEVS